MLQASTLELERNESHTNPEAREARRLALVREARTLHAEVLELVRKERDGRHALCVRLGRIHDGRLWKHVGGCSTFVKYAVKFGAARSPTEARQLVTLAHQLPQLRILGPMFERGEVDWTKVRLVARAVLKRPEDEPRWAREVLVSSYNALRAKVQVALDESPTKDVTLSVPLDLDAQAEHVRVVAGERLGLKLTRAELLQLILDAALDAGFLDDLRPASAVDEEDAADPSAAVRTAAPGRRAASKGAPTTCFLVRHCPRCEEAEVDAADASVPLRPERAAQLAVDAWLLTEEGALSRTIPVHIRRRVFARDRGRCVVPGCGSRRGLHFHHTGGWKRTGHDEDQLALLCRACHVHLHHGWYSMHGRHSTRFRFLDADGEELVGDVSTWRPPRAKARVSAAPPRRPRARSRGG